MRSSGILMPVSSLDSRHGIGCFSREAYAFVDFLKESGQTFWQILPVGPTGFGDSPYQSVSAFAGNPYYVDPEGLKDDGLLSSEEIEEFSFGDDPETVDYGKLYNYRYLLLKKAYDSFVEKGFLSSEDYAEFKTREADWLDDYTLFMALKRKNDGKSWTEWEAPLRHREESAVLNARNELSELMEFFCFIQYEFYRQYHKLHAYAKKKGIRIIGDMPFYVAMDSADAWAHAEIFRMDQDHQPLFTAGTAPDAFSPKGQIWGNPVYDWKAMKKNGYVWWLRRLEHAASIFDVIRIDHFHGFSSYYAIPFKDKDAQHGIFEKGPGMDFFKAVQKRFGQIDLIAEDLGEVTEENRQLLLETGIPGMKILQYAFTSWDSIYMPHKLEKNCVIYTGTHDNPTTRAWLETLSEGELSFARRYIRSWNTDFNAMTWDLIREAMHSVADLCIIPLQDYLCKGNEARINTPGTSQGNWTWRIPPKFLSHELAEAIHEITATYGRIPYIRETEDEQSTDTVSL